MGTSSLFYAVVVDIGISATYCSKLNAWRQPGPNLWLLGKWPKNGPPVGFWRRARIFKQVVIDRGEAWVGYRSDEENPTFPRRGILLQGKTYFLRDREDN